MAAALLKLIPVSVRLWVYLRFIEFVVKFLRKRGLRIARNEWVEMLIGHLEVIDAIKDIVGRHHSLSNFRVKHPKECARLINLCWAMQDSARQVALALVPPITRQLGDTFTALTPPVDRQPTDEDGS